MRGTIIQKFASILETIAELERQNEIVRQVLSEQPEFDPYLTFKFLEKKKTGQLTKSDMIDFLIKNDIHPTQFEVIAIIQRFDSNKDEKLSFQDFLNMILPTTASALRNVQQQFREQKKQSDQTEIALNVEWALARVFERELQNNRQIENMKQQFYIKNQEIDIKQIFMQIIYSSPEAHKDYIDNNHLYYFLKNNHKQSADEDIIAIFRRLDTDLDGKITFKEFLNAFEWSNTKKSQKQTPNKITNSITPTRTRRSITPSRQLKQQQQQQQQSSSPVLSIRQSITPQRKKKSPNLRVHSSTSTRLFSASSQVLKEDEEEKQKTPFNSSKKNFFDEKLKCQGKLNKNEKNSKNRIQTQSKTNVKSTQKIIHNKENIYKKSPIQNKSPTPYKSSSSGIIHNFIQKNVKIQSNLNKISTSTKIQLQDNNKIPEKKYDFLEGELKIVENTSELVNKQTEIKITNQYVHVYQLISELVQEETLIEKIKIQINSKDDFKLVDIFRMFDQEGKGAISIQNFENVLTQHLSNSLDSESISKIFNILDKDSDNLLKYSDFYTIFTPKKKEDRVTGIKPGTSDQKTLGEETTKLISQLFEMLTKNELNAVELRVLMEQLQCDNIDQKDAYNAYSSQMDVVQINYQTFRDILTDYNLNFKTSIRKIKDYQHSAPPQTLLVKT